MSIKEMAGNSESLPRAGINGRVHEVFIDVRRGLDGVEMLPFGQQYGLIGLVQDLISKSFPVFIKKF